MGNIMRWKTAHLQARLYLVAATVLLVGLGSAVFIYLSAEETTDSTLVSEFLNSKRYLHDVKSYGGNASVLADQFSRWFDGLWHGESLAFTVAFITIVVSFVLFVIGYYSPHHE
jgi:hypothetical protein